MADVKIVKDSNVYIRVIADNGIRMGMNEYFARYVKNYRFHPKFKAKVWDGKARIFQYRTGLIYAGLIKEVLQYCKQDGLTVEVDPEVRNMFDYRAPDLDKYLTDINLHAYGERIEFRDYQKESIIQSITQKRKIIQSPTSSGKSSVIYGICRYLLDKAFMPHESILIVVPTINLVTQLQNDFKDYSVLNGWNVDKYVGVYMGEKKQPEKQIIVCTWQSIYKFDATWFARFRGMVFDEVHQVTDNAKSILGIGERCNAEFRIGLSGSIDAEDETTELSLTGLFGFKKIATTTKELMDAGTVASLSIKCFKTSYSNIANHAATFKERDYKKEIDWIVSQTARNEFIADLANSVGGSTLILFGLVEKHGKPLLRLLQAREKEVFFVYGGTDADQRENIRVLAETHKGCVILASYQTFSTGVSIRNIHNIIFASPTKSFSRVIQSIGRGLRISGTKKHCDVYDIFDHLYGNDKAPELFNHTLKHFVERLKIYIKQEFDYSIETLILDAN